ncbi:alpha-1,2-mannosidase subfamily [Purpureocillium lavendulum]|uniref:Alpha-1,2-mannosidase subfamily n=1 Tax=Purpureocillium lavendulum TaxID=1247861 RepID=A0AB34FGM1_9HYPO|nr:alpha-1,2-mannosidase subfamily [Purpureocillium lavendulum]
MADHEARPIGHPSATSEPCTEDYTTGWICALQEEYEAACRMLDVEYDGPETTNEHDNNTYVFGRISKHNVIIGCLPGGRYGTNSAATVVRDMVRSFPHLKFALMVGIGGGAPTPDKDIRLGDVVVSEPHGKLGGVLQYDFGKRLSGARFQLTGQLNSPPAVLLGALPEMRRRHNDPRKADKILEHLKLMDDMPDYQRPADDRLYRADYVHTGGATCAACDTNGLEERAPRTDQRTFNVHYGTIASANSVMKDAKDRDQLSRDPELNVLCFEMEAAGLMNNFPCLVIRGICDYSDSHKNDEWHKFAALAAAAYARELLHVLKPAKVITLPPWADRFDYGPTQSDYLARRQPGTGQWLLESDEFQGWLTTSRQTLFCPGIPGAGKTILTSIVVDELESRFRNDPKTGIAYIYCNFQRQEEQGIDHLLASLVKQLAQRHPAILSNLKAVYDRHSISRTRPSVEEIVGLVHSVAAVYARVFVVVDALDECQASGRCRTRFLSELFGLQKVHETNIFATSRSIPDIVDLFKAGVSLEIRASANDVARYLENHIQELPTLVQKDGRLQEEITTGILEAVDGMFLLAPIYLNSLHECMTRNEIRSALELLPKRKKDQVEDEDGKVGVLARAYDDAMRRIQGQRPRLKELAMEVLSWITFAKRQLTTSELQHALATKTGKLELDYGDLPDIGDMVSVCTGIVTVDATCDIIRLVHYTAQEYLLRTHGQWFPEAESIITATCVTYLSFTVFESGYCTTNSEFETRLRSYQFYDYASRNWGYHSLMDVKPGQGVISFLENNNKAEASSQALMAAKRHSSDVLYSGKVPRNITGLHLAVHFGMCEAAKALIKRGHSPNLKDTLHRTPLWYAANAGHNAIVKLLLEAGANANVAAFGDDGRASFLLISMINYLKVLTHLPHIAADGNSPAMRDVCTACQVGVGASHEELADEVRSWEANAHVAACIFGGRTALQAAAEGGHLEVVETLLAERADINAAAAALDGRTALQAAAAGGHLEVVEKLLAAKADINAAAAVLAGLTALQAAAARGHLEIVEKLLAAGADINAPAVTFVGRTALQAAADGGHLEIVEMLLAESADINAAAATVGGLTALQAAALRGHPEIVATLLAAGAEIDAAAAPLGGRTALEAATIQGHKAIAQLLNAKGSVAAV